MSKLWLYQFMLVLFEYLEPNSFTLAYIGDFFFIKIIIKIVFSDTDSVLLGLTGLTLDSLVLPSKRADWKNNIVPKWFADETPTGQKTPGFFKEEFASTKGKFIGLRFLILLNS